MSKSKILAELPSPPKPRNGPRSSNVYCDLQDHELIRGVGPTAQEKKLLDDALAEFQRDGDPGTAWREALHRVRSAPME